MGAILCKSNSKEDIIFARKYGVWQADRFGKNLKSGDHLLLYVTGVGKEEDAILVGIITSDIYETAPFNWPSGAMYSKTISFKPMDYSGQWSSKRL